MTITTDSARDPAVLAAARARAAEIRQAARDTYTRITGGHEGVITLSSARSVPDGPASAGPGTVNVHPGPDFRGGEAA